MTTSPAPQPADGEREVACRRCRHTKAQHPINDRGMREDCGEMGCRCPLFLPERTTPASAEPTDDDRAKAIVAMSQALDSDRLTVGHAIALVARLLASQRAEIVARYEQVADELDREAAHFRSGAFQGVTYEAAARIREAAPK